MASILLSACSISSIALGPEAANAPHLDIRKGSSTEDLIETLGEPTSIKPYESDRNVQIWTYELEKSHTEMVAYDSKKVPYVDPITGEMKMIMEPDYKPETKTRAEVIQVFIVNDAVLGWKVDRKEERSVLK